MPEPGLCKCGCGEATRVQLNGRVNKFVNGHNRALPRPGRAPEGFRFCSDCKECLPLDRFYKRRTPTGRVLPWGQCIACMRVRTLARRNKLYDSTSFRAVAERYGISKDEMIALWEAQAGRCAICSDPLDRPGSKTGKRRGFVDHDHPSGEVRGLLCPSCNSGCGQFHDDPAMLRRAAAYLEAGGTRGRVFAIQVMPA